jgi:hypothetical protein
MSDYWKSTSLYRNIAINDTIGLLRNEGMDPMQSHNVALEIEKIWLKLMKELGK